jgi:FAD/FMN-containing dehydrogenase
MLGGNWEREPRPVDRNGLTRRGFLAEGAALGAAVGLAACGGSSRSATGRPHGQLARLAGRLQGRVIVPGTPGYNAARRVNNARYDWVRPAAIVEAASPQDIAETIAFVRETDAQFVLRSGGHSMAGYSTGPGIVLDVSRLNRITVDAGGTRARVGPGVTLIQLLTQLAEIRQVVPAGTCPTVGINGLTLGGGIGHMTRKYGLTLDLLRRVELVDAAGRRLTADEHTHPDLFWASRGGGGGNFGVVTELEFELVPLPPVVTRYSFRWPWSQRSRAFAVWQEWSVASPPEFQDYLVLSTGGTAVATPYVEVSGMYLGPESKATPHLDGMLASVGAAPTLRQIDTTDYVTAVKDVFCRAVPVQLCVPEPEGKAPRWGLSIKSTFLDRVWPQEALDVISDWLERRQRNPLMTRLPIESNLGKIWFDALGGAASSVPPEATAFVHRHAASCAQYQSRWNVDAPAAVRAANIAWLESFHASMAKWNRGAYVNYPDPTLEDFAEQYYGANLPRLQAVKRAYDPDNLFHFAQSIPV